MKRYGRIRKLSAYVLTGLLIAAFSLNATVLVPAKEKAPSLTIEAVSTSTGAVVPGVELSVYQVADMDASRVYSVKDEFRSFGLDIKSLESASEQLKTAEQMVIYINDNGFSGARKVVTDGEGKAVLPDMADGLYLVWKTGAPGTDLLVEMKPFFVSLPMMAEDGQSWNYDVTALPKMTTQTAPSPTDPTDPTNPTNPTDPTNPTNPTDPTDPTNPTEPTNPTDPTNPVNPTDPVKPDNGGGGGGGGGGRRPDRDHSGRNPQTPTENITDNDTPLASFPETPKDPGTPGGPELITIEDAPVPLSMLPHIPKLGDMGMTGYLTGFIICLLLGSAAFVKRWQYGRGDSGR